MTKSRSVEPSGAVGMILYNTSPLGLNTDNHYVPSVHIDQPDSDDFLDFMATETTVTATWTTGIATEVPGDVMASFSSRPARRLPQARRHRARQILAGNSPVPVGADPSQPGHLFQAIQGTSMSSPHAAGVAALVRAAHPDWTPGQTKSALMTSSIQDVLKEDGVSPADPFDRGAGSIRANRAIGPTVTFDVDASDHYASAGDPLGRVHLNLPSIYANPMPGGVATDRTFTNVSGASTSGGRSSSAPRRTPASASPRTDTP